MDWKYKLYEDYAKNKVGLISKQGYGLLIDLSNPEVGEGFQIHFEASALRPIGSIPITSRNFEEYRNIYEDNWGLLAVNFGSKFQYIEIGAGLGEFIPAVIRKFPDIGKKPVVIDPANYELMLDMMKEGRKRLKLGKELNDKLEERIERAEIILNPNKVRLINMKLGEAIIKHPEIYGIGDVVVEHCGPCTYSNTENAYGIRKVMNMGKKLVKKNGIFVLNGEIIKD